MGNKFGKSSGDSKFTKPTGLYPTCEWDDKTVKKLINKKKVAPRYPGREEPGPELDECPICFLWYPGGLNRSKCCKQPICTECYLQFKKPNSQKQVTCPFCNSLNYAVKYTGCLTKEERSILEQEEQKVIEAKLQARKAELERQVEREKEVAAERAAERERRAREPPPPPPPPVVHEPHVSSPAGGREWHGGRSNDHDDDSNDHDDNPHDPSRSRHRPHRPSVAPQSAHDGGEEDLGGGGMDIEELMIMEAIRLSLMDGQRQDRGSAEPRDDEAGAAGSGHSADSDLDEYSDEDDDMNGDRERRASDSEAEEDWPATAWGEDLAPAAAAVSNHAGVTAVVSNHAAVSNHGGGFLCRLLQPESRARILLSCDAMWCAFAAMLAESNPRAYATLFPIRPSLRVEFELVLDRVLFDEEQDGELERLHAQSVIFFSVASLLADASLAASRAFLCSPAATGRYNRMPSAVESDSTLSPARSITHSPPPPSPFSSRNASMPTSSEPSQPNSEPFAGFPNTPQALSGSASAGAGAGTPAERTTQPSPTSSAPSSPPVEPVDIGTQPQLNDRKEEEEEKGSDEEDELNESFGPKIDDMEAEEHMPDFAKELVDLADEESLVANNRSVFETNDDNNIQAAHEHGGEEGGEEGEEEEVEEQPSKPTLAELRRKFEAGASSSEASASGVAKSPPSLRWASSRVNPRTSESAPGDTQGQDAMVVQAEAEACTEEEFAQVRVSPKADGIDVVDISDQTSTELGNDTADCRDAAHTPAMAQSAESEDGAAPTAAVHIATVAPDISGLAENESLSADAQSQDEPQALDACAHLSPDSAPSLSQKTEEAAYGQATVDMQYVDMHGVSGENGKESQKLAAAVGPHVDEAEVDEREIGKNGQDEVEKAHLERAASDSDLVPSVGKRSDAEVAENGSHDAGLECLQRLATVEDPSVPSTPV